ncbi:ABC-2 transporter permease [Salicibibacter kimchii]|uniref:ABC-2 transporter permease n=1 Tax=Salicibibacter kimchii TaxID=2099786 RepID=A0A345C014_9BACI|nr:ABC-2 transporter permease [Salicibibacter kimchii]AXF56545.1 ABC-2 transporter permease [Salicibibacter kimchii]
MKALLLKEYDSNQSTYAATFIFFAVAAWVIGDDQIPSFVSILFVGVYLFSTSYVDDQNNSHILINSLPVNRCLVVTSKYINGLLVGMLLLILTIVPNILIPGYTPLTEIALAAAAIMMVIAFYYPIYIIFGHRFMGYVFSAVLIGLLVMGPILSNTNVLDTIVIFLQQQSTVALMTGVTAASILILILSWMISVRVYVAKQF